VRSAAKKSWALDKGHFVIHTLGDPWAFSAPVPGRAQKGRTSASSVGYFFEGSRSMHTLSQSLLKFLKDEDGPTAVEYAVMLALIIVVCIAAILTLGQNASSIFNKVATTVSGT
jgi:pilus assembly protein Flp/PilA